MGVQPRNRAAAALAHAARTLHWESNGLRCEGGEALGRQGRGPGWGQKEGGRRLASRLRVVHIHAHRLCRLCCGEYSAAPSGNQGPDVVEVANAVPGHEERPGSVVWGPLRKACEEVREGKGLVEETAVGHRIQSTRHLRRTARLAGDAPGHAVEQHERAVE